MICPGCNTPIPDGKNSCPMCGATMEKIRADLKSLNLECPETIAEPQNISEHTPQQIHQPSDTRKNKSSIRKTIISIIGIFIALRMCSFTSHQQVPVSPAPASIQPTPETVAAPQKNLENNYTGAQKAKAQDIMEQVRRQANVFEEGGNLVVEFHNYLYPNDIDKRLQVVRAVADADCILSGRPRSIFFYNPGNKQIAQADKLNGVRLKE